MAARPALQADGWSAQYPGSTAVMAAMAGAGTCTKQPCLFDLEDDPRETNDLAAQNPQLTAKLFARHGTAVCGRALPVATRSLVTGNP